MTEKAETIYLDHGATSWPKPHGVCARMVDLFDGVCANAGRSGHRASLASARILFDAREKVAQIFGVSDSARIVITRGTTEGANLVFKGFLKEGDKVFITPMEHNSVMRPLDRLAGERGVVVRKLPADPLGRVDWGEARKLASDGAPRLVAVCHGSNVNGVVQDLNEARKAFPDSALFVDAAQTAGVLPIRIEESGIDFLACSAHKGLLGPTGVGICALNPKYRVEPLMEGGTGSRSEHTVQPDMLPDRYESGTMNIHGVAGFLGALEHVEKEGLSGDPKRELVMRLIDGVGALPGVRVHSPVDGSALLVSLTMEGVTADRMARRLETEFGILCRPGLHCAPSAHDHLGTFPDGTVRIAPGFGNTQAHIDCAVEALGRIASSR